MLPCARPADPGVTAGGVLRLVVGARAQLLCSPHQVSPGHRVIGLIPIRFLSQHGSARAIMQHSRLRHRHTPVLRRCTRPEAGPAHDRTDSQTLFPPLVQCRRRPAGCAMDDIPSGGSVAVVYGCGARMRSPGAASQEQSPQIGARKAASWMSEQPQLQSSRPCILDTLPLDSVHL